MPLFGQKTLYYPLGYGYCQCGCKKVTQQDQSGTYVRHITGHQSLPTPSEKIQKDSSPPLNAKKYFSPDQALLDKFFALNSQHNLLCAQITLSREEIELVIKMIRGFWKDSIDGRDVVIEKLRLILRSLDFPVEPSFEAKGTMQGSIPSKIGEKTGSYPLGYGFCQCGCNKLTKLNPDGIWAIYIEGHQPR